MVITVPELTYMANHIQSTYFVVFETFAVAILLYWLLCTIVEAGVQAPRAGGGSAARCLTTTQS